MEVVVVVGVRGGGPAENMDPVFRPGKVTQKTYSPLATADSPLRRPPPNLLFASLCIERRLVVADRGTLNDPWFFRLKWRLGHLLEA